MVNPEETFKECENCHSEKLLVNFPRSRKFGDGFNIICKECLIEEYKQLKRLRDINIKIKTAEPIEHNNLIKEIIKIKLNVVDVRINRFKVKKKETVIKIKIDIKNIRSSYLHLKIKRKDKSCVLCSSNYKLHVHHIIPVNKDKSKIKDPANLVTLCFDCHKKVHNKNWSSLNESYITILLDYTTKRG